MLDLLERHPNATKSSGHLFATLMDGLVDSYFDTTDVLEDKLEVVEDNIFNDDAAHRAGAAARPVHPPPRVAGAAPRRRAVARGAVGDPAQRGRTTSTAMR